MNTPELPIIELQSKKEDFFISSLQYIGLEVTWKQGYFASSRINKLEYLEKIGSVFKVRDTEFAIHFKYTSTKR